MSTVASENSSLQVDVLTTKTLPTDMDQSEVQPLGESTVCPGVSFPDWPAPFITNYPFAEHATKALPSCVVPKVFFFFHEDCEGVTGIDDDYCKKCASLKHNTQLKAICERSSVIFSSSGDMVGRTYDSLTHGQSIFMAKFYRDAKESLRLNEMNLTRKLQSTCRALDDTSRFISAIAENDHGRISQIVQAGLKHGDSVSAIHAKFDAAIAGVYSCKGFTNKEIAVGLVDLRLGGPKVVEAHRVLHGGPSV